MAPARPMEVPEVSRILASFQPNKTKVTPSDENDQRMALGTKGKRTVSGVVQLTACINRSHSEPFFRTQPQGWHAARHRNDLQYTAHLQKIRKDTIRQNPSIVPKSHVQGEITAVMEHTPPEPCSPSRREWYSSCARSHSSPGHANSQSNYWDFRPGGVGPTSAEIITKARDHIGYGKGLIARGDCVKSAVSLNSPSWFPGMRMVPGPYNVPRLPSVDIIDGKMSTNKRRYVRGENLSIVDVGTPETSRSPQNADTPKLSFRTPRFDDWREYKRNVDGGFRCVHKQLMCDRSPCENKKLKGRSSMIGGGCTVFQPYFPRADAVTLDPPFAYTTPTQPHRLSSK